MKQEEQKKLLEQCQKGLDKDTKKKLNELKLSFGGKLFWSGVASYLAGGAMKKLKLPVKVRGDKKKMKAMIDALVASKSFQDELKKGKSIDQIVDKLKLRNVSKQDFERITKTKWPL